MRHATDTKQDLAYFAAGLLERGRAYSASDIDRLIRGAVHPRWLTDPRLAPDHVRLAMVEGGLVERDPGGAEYRLSERFLAPADLPLLTERVAELLAACEPDGRVRCPACGYWCGAAGLTAHVETYHGSTRWLKLTDKFGA